jgi:1-acyl-sn-glycerol-3-phosphate acyltransferase
MSIEGGPPRIGEDPVVVYTNHPSWWDPIHFALLAAAAMPTRRMFGPFDAAALAKYPMFGRFGAFGIDPSTRRGAAEFLRTCRAILAEPDATLWITSQGEFSDPRRRPLVLQPGLAHLIRRLERGQVIPLAVEYPFWNERRPEALSYFGRPIDAGEVWNREVQDLNALLVERLTETMDALAGQAITRDPDRFRTVVLGRAGVGGVYDAGRRLRAWIRGRRFDSAHGDDRR